MARIGRPPNPNAPHHGESIRRNSTSIGRPCTFLGCKHVITAKGAKSYCSHGGHISQVIRFGIDETRKAWNAGLALSIQSPKGEQAFVYLLEFPRLTKLGRTVDPVGRFREHAKVAGEIIEVHHLEWVSEAPALESYLLRQAAIRGLRPVFGREWFPLSCLPFFKKLLEPLGV